MRRVKSGPGLCPSALFQQDSAIRAVVERSVGDNLTATVPVEVRADAVTRIEITADAANPRPVRSGATLRYVVTAFDANDVPVLHPVGSDAPLNSALPSPVRGMPAPCACPAVKPSADKSKPWMWRGAWSLSSQCRAVRPQPTPSCWLCAAWTERCRR